MNKYKSRRYTSAWGLTWLATALLTIPWVADLVSASTITALITPDVWSTIVIAIWGSYFAANAATKGLYAWGNSKVEAGLDPETFDKAG